jgi:hypothetical protein
LDELVWSNGGMILTVEILSIGRKILERVWGKCLDVLKHWNGFDTGNQKYWEINIREIVW